MQQPIDSAHTTAKKIAADALTPHAARNDKEARFPEEGIKALGEAGLLALTIPRALGGQEQGPRAFARVVEALAEADPSAGMIYVMHICATAVLLNAQKSAQVSAALADIAAGRNLTTLAFSEKGSRSHFWAPVSKASKNGTGITLNALKSWVTSAGHAHSYVVSTLSHLGKGPTDSTLYLVAKANPGARIASAWDGMGLRANASSPITLESCVVDDGSRLTDEGMGFKSMLEVVLPMFNLGCAAMGLGICRAAVGATVSHLKTSQFEHLGALLGESLPTLRAGLAEMQIRTDALAALIDDTVAHLETPGDSTMLRVLEVKAAAGETSIEVTSKAMRLCGGAAFSKHLGVDRYFRDAHASAVMAPTADVLREFIGKALLGIPLF